MEDKSEKMFKCPLCETVESSVDMLIHVVRAHSIDREYRHCVFCDQMYTETLQAVGVIELRRRAAEHLDCCVNYAASMLAGRIVK